MAWLPAGETMWNAFSFLFNTTRLLSWQLGAVDLPYGFGTVAVFSWGQTRKEKRVLDWPFFSNWLILSSFLFFFIPSLLRLMQSIWFEPLLPGGAVFSYILSESHNSLNNLPLFFKPRWVKSRPFLLPPLLPLLPSAKNANAFPSHKTVLLHPCPQSFSHTPTQAQVFFLFLLPPFVLPFSLSFFSNNYSAPSTPGDK